MSEILDYEVDIDIEAIRMAATEATKKFREIEKAASAMGDSISQDIKSAMSTSKAEAVKYAKEYKKQLDKIEKDSERSVNKQTEDLKKPFDEARKKFDSLETAAGALGLPFAGIFGSLRDINGSLGDSVEVGGKASASFLTWGIGIGAAVAGVALIGAGIIGAVSAADDLARELEDYNKLPGFGVTPEELASIDDANAAFQGITDIASNLVVQFASYVAPAVGAVTEGIIGLYFQAQNAFTWISSYTEYIAGVLYDKLKPAITIISEGFTDIKNTVATVFESVKSSIMGALKTVFAYISKIPGMGYLKSVFDDVTTALSSVKVETIDAEKATESFMGVAKKRSKENSEWYKKEKEELTDLKEAREKSLEIELLAKYTKNLEESETKQKEFFKGIELYSEQAIKGYQNLYDIQKQLDGMKPKSIDLKPIEYDIKIPEFTEGPSWFGKATGVASSIMGGFSSAFGMAGQIYGVFESLAQQTPEQIKEMINGVADTFVSVADKLPELINSLVEALPAVIPKIVDALVSVLNYLAVDGIPVLMDMALSFITAIVEALPVLIPSLINAAGSFIGAIIGAIPEIISVLVTHAPDIIVAIISGLLSAVIQIIAGVLESLGLNSAAESLRGFANSMSSSSSGGGSTSGGSASGGTTSNTTASNVSGYKSEQLGDDSIDVTDAYISNTDAKSIKTTTGDSAFVYQKGGVNDLASLLKGILFESVKANKLREDGNKLLNKIYNKDSNTSRTATPAKSQR